MIRDREACHQKQNMGVETGNARRGSREDMLVSGVGGPGLLSVRGNWAHQARAETRLFNFRRLFWLFFVGYFLGGKSLYIRYIFIRDFV